MPKEKGANIDTIVIRTDGAARGNPGPAGAGAVICDESGDRLEEAAEYLGETTNNVAEYRGLLLGLKIASRYQAKRARIYLDSELLVNQLNGVYKVKNPALKELYLQVQGLISGYARVSVTHVPRKQNAEADRLANEAIDNFATGDRAPGAVADRPEQGSLF